MSNAQRSEIPAHPHNGSRTLPLPCSFGSNQDAAVTDQLGAGFLVNGRNADGAVMRHEQGPNSPFTISGTPHLLTISGPMRPPHQHLSAIS